MNFKRIIKYILHFQQYYVNIEILNKAIKYNVKKLHNTVEITWLVGSTHDIFMWKFRIMWTFFFIISKYEGDIVFKPLNKFIFYNNKHKNNVVFLFRGDKTIHVTRKCSACFWWVTPFYMYKCFSCYIW